MQSRVQVKVEVVEEGPEPYHYMAEEVEVEYMFVLVEGVLAVVD